jgi:uncharacterized protein YeaO (DUF488 family)
MDMNIQVKHINQIPSEKDGYRVLAERDWPLGISRDDAKVDSWMRDLAPSEGQYAWFSGKPERWATFESGYFEELEDKYEQVAQLIKWAMKDTVTILHSTGDDEHNAAVALKHFLEEHKDRILQQVA